MIAAHSTSAARDGPCQTFDGGLVRDLRRPWVALRRDRPSTETKPLPCRDHSGTIRQLRVDLGHFCSLTDAEACYEAPHQRIERVTLFEERPRSSVDRAAAF
jgi:hypothetical protein